MLKPDCPCTHIKPMHPCSSSVASELYYYHHIDTHHTLELLSNFFLNPGFMGRRWKVWVHPKSFECFVRSQHCREWPATCMLALGIIGFSQVSVMKRTQQSWTRGYPQPVIQGRPFCEWWIWYWWGTDLAEVACVDSSCSPVGPAEERSELLCW